MMPRVSPDGKRVRFTAFDPAIGKGLLWEAGSDGSNAHALWQDWEPSLGQCCGTWSPDGRYFYFQTYAEFVEGQIWVTPGKESWGARRQNPTALTQGPLGFAGASPSRDGKRLFVRGSQLRASLLRYDQEKKSFVPYLGGLSATDVDVSRDGQWVTYVAYPEMTLWRSRTDGSDRKQLTFGAQAFLPQWSADAKHIAFTQIAIGKPCRMMMVSIDGGAAKEILPEDSQAQIDVTWDGDKNRVYFGRVHLDPDLSIFSFDLDTRKMTRIPGSDGLTAPRASPDGRYVLALSKDWSRLMLYDVASQTWSELVNQSTGQIGYASWTHDSRYVIARMGPGPGRRIAKIDLADHKVTTAIRYDDIDEPDPMWMGLTEDDSVLIRQDKSLRELYALHLQLPTR
jgi:Tol biopolymer transport system component